MNDRSNIALYFPYIRLPQTPWLTQVLLYWDKAAVLMPYITDTYARSINLDYMEELRKEHLLAFIRPKNMIKNREMFSNAFLELLDSLPLPQQSRSFTPLYLDKLSYPLLREFHKRGLIKDDRSVRYYLVERTTADAYVAYLACATCAFYPEMFPVTDQEQTIGSLAINRGDLQSQLTELRYSTVTRILPAPSRYVPAVELRAFKEENADKLRRCRVYLDGRLADLAETQDPELLIIKAAAMEQELRDDIKFLQERMSKRKWPGVTLVGFGGVTGVALATAAALSTGGSALTAGLSVGAGIFQIGSAGYVAKDLIKQPRYQSRNPLAYSVLASKL